MEFLDFLKYGALGISLALAILSYRLLSKEQDKPEVRKPILNTIKVYFLIAVFLSVFFGGMEIFTRIVSRDQTATDQSLERIWATHFSEYPDTTLAQKAGRISSYLAGEPDRIREIRDQYEECRKELEKFDDGFYQNVIRLRNALNTDEDNWINIDYETESKTAVIGLLKGIFRSLGENYDSLTGKEIVEKWVAFKMEYSDNPKKYTLIENSDITVIVKKYLDLHGED